MTFTLHVDGQRWRDHADRTCAQVRDALSDDDGRLHGSDIAPVAKGNGYGLGIDLLAGQARRLGVGRICVGTPYEVAAAAANFDGDILVLQPWDPRDHPSHEIWDSIRHSRYDHRVIRTIASIDALHDLASFLGVRDRMHERPARIVIEGLTSMRRFGLAEPDLDALLADDVVRSALRTGRVELLGLALHLPLVQPDAPHVRTLDGGWHDTNPIPQLPANASGRVRETWGWALTWIRALAALEDAGCRLSDEAAGLWVSHLDDTELRAVRTVLPDVPVYPRIGTRLWLGDSGALTATGTVLAVHPVSKGRAVGYRQRRSPKDGLLVVVSGGTSNGVALEAPSPASTIRQRVVAAGTGALEATGRARSPFSWGGRLRWFAEPPHMHFSMLWLADDDVREAVGHGHRAPAVGDELACRVRHTTALFDRILVREQES